jgi:hypothetical protein
MESLLTTVVKKLNVGTEDILVPTREDATKLLMGLFSLRHRTESAINSIRKYITNNPDIRKKMNVSEDRDINLVVLENMIHATTHDAIEYSNCHITVFRNYSSEFIIGDQPFLGDIMNNDVHFVVLSPNFFVSIQKSSSGAYFSYSDIPSEFTNSMNEQIARHARKWIVAKDKTTLEKYLSFADELEQDDTPIFEAPKYLFNGYRIT